MGTLTTAAMRSDEVVASDGWRELDRIGATRLRRPTPAELRGSTWDWYRQLPGKDRALAGSVVHVPHGADA